MPGQNNIQNLIVSKARKGDAKAQERLYHIYSKAMYNICTRMTGNRPDADDVMQEGFIHAFANLHQLKDPAAFGGWLRKIIVNKCILKTKHVIRWTDLDEECNNLPQDDNSNWWSEIDPSAIQEEIKNLPQGCRQVFLLYVMEDFSHKAIADALGISESTSKSQYQRARQILMKRITRKILNNG